MSPAFIAGIGAHLPEAQITFDRFHLMQHLSGAIDQVRREELKSQPLLKKARYVLLKNRENLTPKQADHLWQLEAPSLRLKSVRAMLIRETFQQIYQAESVQEFSELLAAWYSWAIRSRLEPIKVVARMIKRHWDGVVAWKRSALSNGLLEGFNSLIQAAKRKARGYRTAKTFQIIAYVLTARLDFSSVNPTILPT
jgi:transposase